MIFYLLGTGMSKMQFLFWNFEFSCISWRNRSFDFFLKIYFYIKISESLSTYSNYECLSIKSRKYAINTSGWMAIWRLNLLCKEKVSIIVNLSPTLFTCSPPTFVGLYPKIFDMCKVCTVPTVVWTKLHLHLAFLKMLDPTHFFSR